MPRSKEAAMRRKKKGRFTKKESPFPIPMTSVAGEPVKSWFYFTGFIEGSTVVVRHSGDMDYLHRMGFFGKGTLSRSQPNFSERRQKVAIELPQRNGQHKVVQAAVVTKRSYLAHRRFKALAGGKMKEYNDIVYHEEQQQGFVDSSDEEEEDEEEEEKMDEDSSDDDSVSSADVDTGKMTAFKLLNQENSHLSSGEKNARAMSGDFVSCVDISQEVRSHIISMLAKISTLSNEQITTFLQVPQEMAHLAERYKKMRKAEFNTLQQAYAAKYPGRNFRKGEVITLDEDDSISESRHCGNESDNAVVISDSDEGGGEDKSDNDDDGSKRSGLGGRNSTLGQGNDTGGKKLNKKERKVGSSKRDSADWSSDDSNFWSEDPPVKGTSYDLQTPAAEGVLQGNNLQVSTADESVLHGNNLQTSTADESVLHGNNLQTSTADESVLHGNNLQTSTAEENVLHGNNLQTSTAEESVLHGDNLQTSTAEENVLQGNASKNEDLFNIENKKSVDASNNEDNIVSTNTDQETDCQSVSVRLVEDGGDKIDGQQLDEQNKAECNASGENESVGKTDHQDADGSEAGVAQELSNVHTVASKSKEVGERDKQLIDAKDISECNSVVENKSLEKTNHLDTNGGDKVNDSPEDKDNRPNSSSSSPSVADNISSLLDNLKTPNNAAPDKERVGEVCSAEDLMIKDDDKLSNINTELNDMKDSAVHSSSVNGNPDVSFVKDGLDTQENSIPSSEFSLETSSSKTGEDSGESEKKTSGSERAETSGQSQDSGVEQVLSAGTGPGHVIARTETISLDTEKESKVSDSVLKIGVVEDLTEDLEENKSSHPDRDSHKQSVEKSKTSNISGFQIDTETTSEVKDKFVVLSDSVENVTNIDSDNSNDSDDVICIESKSAEPKKLHHFLSQPVKKVPVPLVTKSVTFMSSITEEPTFVRANVGFQSWGPLLHFNFTGDPSHLPTVMAVSSASSPPAGQRAPANGQTQKGDVVYERIYPPIRSLIPSGNSTGAVIKQRIKGLPFLNLAYTHVLQADDAGSDLESSQTNNLKDLTSKPPQSRFQPYTRMLVDQQFPPLLATKPAQLNSLHSLDSSQQVCLDAPKIQFSQISSYLEAYQSVSTPSTSDQMEVQDGTKTPRTSASLASLSSVIVRISDLYNAVSSKDTLDISVEDQAKHKTETDTVLAEFYLALSNYLSCLKISSTLEAHILARLLSDTENNSEVLCSEELAEAKKRLSAFNKWLLKKRSEYLKRDQQGENHLDLQKVVVVDLTNNSSDKVRVSNPKSGVESSVVVDLTEKSEMSLSDSLNYSKFEKTTGDLIADPVIKTNSFVKKSTTKNGSLIIASDDIALVSDGTSRQQTEGKNEAGSLRLTNSENTSESLSEENIKRDINGQISARLSEECKHENSSKQNGCKDLQEDTEDLSAGDASKNLPEKNVIEKLLDRKNEVNISEKDGDECTNLVEANVSKSVEAKPNNEVVSEETLQNNDLVSEETKQINKLVSEETKQINELVSEETVKHSQKTLETENRKRKFERSLDEGSEVNGKKLKSEEDTLLDFDIVDEKTCASTGIKDQIMDTDDSTVVGLKGGLEVESKSLEESEKTADSFSGAETSLKVLDQQSCLLDKSVIEVSDSQKPEIGQLSLDSGSLPSKITGTDQEVRASGIDQILTTGEAKEDIGCVKEGASDSCVGGVELTTPSEVEHVKTESSSSSETLTPCQQGPSKDSADTEVKKDDHLSSLGNENGSSAITLDDSVEMMDTSAAFEVKQGNALEMAEELPSTSSSVKGLKSEKLMGNSDGLVPTGGREQPTNVINCVVSSESDSEDVSCVSDIEKSKFSLNPLVRKVSEKREAPKKSGKGSLQNPSTSKDIHIFIGSSSSDEAEEPPAKRHTSEKSSTPQAHPYSTRDDPDGDLFVVANTSDEDYEDCSEEEYGEEERVRKKQQIRWRSCVKKDPYPTEEKLHLMLEEAFFLSFGLGCLRILDPEMKLLDLTQMWQQFQVLKEHFIPHYVAYHYFRSKGWVPKSGLKFGCDLILYREGPPFYHGSYSVVVIAVKDSTLLPVSTRGGAHLDNRKLNWVSLAGLNRITEHVAKELMLCYVIWPANMTSEESLSPDCISRFKVKELVVSRWVSSQERENKFGEEEMP